MRNHERLISTYVSSLFLRISKRSISFFVIGVSAIIISLKDLNQPVIAKDVFCTAGPSKEYSDTSRDVVLGNLGIIVKLRSGERSVLLNDGSVEIMPEQVFQYYQCMISAQKSGIRVSGGISPTTDNIKLISKSDQSILTQLLKDIAHDFNVSVKNFDWHGINSVLIYNGEYRGASAVIGIPLNGKLLVITPGYQRPLEGERGVYAWLSRIRPLNQPEKNPVK